MKKCTKCEIEKPLTEFHKRKKSKDGHRIICKTCVRQRQAEYNARPEVKEKTKQYYIQNKEKIIQRQAEYNARPEVKEKKRQYYIQNKEKIIQRQAEYSARPEIKEKRRQYRAEYRARPEIKEKRRQYRAEYNARPEVKEKAKQRLGQRYVQKTAEQPACIYQIKNVINNKVYIGETTVGQLRWRDHLIRLRGDRHENPSLQQDFNEHGEEVFKWSIIKEFPKDKEILILEEAREIQRRMDKGEELYNKQRPTEEE